MPLTDHCVLENVKKKKRSHCKKKLVEDYILLTKPKKKQNVTLIDTKVEIHGITYDLTHLDNLK